MSDVNRNLWKAIRQDSSSKALEALEQGANPNFTKEQGLSVLMYAVWLSRTEIVRLLCEKGAHVNYQHPITGDTALMIAVSGAQIETVRILCEYGANKSLVAVDGKRAEDYIEESNAFSQIETILDTCGVSDPSLPTAIRSVTTALDPTLLQPANNTDPQGGKRKSRKQKRKSKYRKLNNRSRKH